MSSRCHSKAAFISLFISNEQINSPKIGVIDKRRDNIRGQEVHQRKYEENRKQLNKPKLLIAKHTRPSNP